MIIGERPLSIKQSAGYIRNAYKRVEEFTGIRFGADYLWHVFHPEESDWFLYSEKPAIALCIFRESHPDSQVDFAADLQYAHHFEGRDLCDDEAYRPLLEKYLIPAGSFYQKLHDPVYKEKAHYEFALVKQLQVTGFPALLLQENENRFYLVSTGYTDYETLKTRIDRLLGELSHTVI